MLRSKSREARSGSVDFVQRSHSSIFTRTISASKFCRGDSLNSQIDSNALVPLQQKTCKTKQHLSEDRINRGRIAMQEEVMGMKERVSDAEGERNQEELKAKDRIIECLRVEVEKARGLEAKLAERDVGLGRLREELSNAKLREGHARDLVADHQRRIHELDDEVVNRRLCESKLFDLLAAQTSQYEEKQIEVEECKMEIVSLLKKIQISKNGTTEVDLLKSELKLATEAEEKSRKAMDDLALALKEVATEAAEAKKKCRIAELELNHIKELLRSTEERYEKLLEEAKQETELHENTVHRLRLEAEESLLAWNGREMGFVCCIKKAEEENVRLTNALKVSQQSAREETNKARDILKQAINEANVAKAAADISKQENSQLKDNLVDMEEALQFLSRENERLRINEAAAYEKVDQLKLMLSSLSHDYKVHVKKQKGMLKSCHTDSDKSEDEEYAEADERSKKAPKAAAEDLENLDTHLADDSDIDKQSNRRRRALFRKVGDLILRRSFSISRKEPVPDPTTLIDNSVLKT